VKHRKIVNKFQDYLSQQGLTSFSYDHIINFLTIQFNKSGNTFCDARTALSTTIRMNLKVEITKHPLLRHQGTAVSSLKPKQPKYDEMWDLDILLQFLTKDDFWPEKLNIRARTRANILFRMSVAGRNRDIAHVDRRTMIWNEDFVKLRLYKWKTKHVEKKSLFRWMVVRKLPPGYEKVCAFTALKYYIDLHAHDYKRLDCRGIWLHYKGKNQISGAALSDKTKDILRLARINIIYTSSIIRHVTITWWRDMGVPLEVVMDRTGHLSVALVLKYYDCSEAQLDLFRELAEQADSNREDFD
jgi:hypothetical protein